MKLPNPTPDPDPQQVRSAQNLNVKDGEVRVPSIPCLDPTILYPAFILLYLTLPKLTLHCRQPNPILDHVAYCTLAYPTHLPYSILSRLVIPCHAHHALLCSNCQDPNYMQAYPYT